MKTMGYRQFILLTLFLLPSQGWTAERVIELKDGKFPSKKIEVELGDTLVFRNSDPKSKYSIYSVTPKAEFDLKIQKPKESKVLKLDATQFLEGDMEVRCAIHRDAVMKVTVKRPKKGPPGAQKVEKGAKKDKKKKSRDKQKKIRGKAKKGPKKGR